jgi:UDP-glucose:(heptosyl)LPS alpha-1,3-glucosyltransferase
MRVGIVIDDLDRRRGGMSEWCWQFVGAANERGYDLHVISQGFGDEPLPAPVSRHRIARTNSRLAFAKDADRLVRELRLDIVHDTGMGWNFDVFQPHGGAYPTWLLRRLDMYPKWFRPLKRVVDAMLPRQRDFYGHWQRQYAALQGTNCNLVALSQFVAQGFLRERGINPDQVTVIYNGVDCRRFSPDHRDQHRATTRQRLGVSDESVLLLLAAHNFRLKGVPELLRAVSRLIAKQYPFHVAIAGGRRVAKWRKFAAGLGIQERVSFLGSVADLVPYYAAADAYVHPTYYDPCSLVILEAAASGLPILTTRKCNGATELFTDGAGILTIAEPTAEDAMCEQLEVLLDARRREHLGAAARNVARRHTFERNVSEILAIYERRAGRRAAA